MHKGQQPISFGRQLAFRLPAQRVYLRVVLERLDLRTYRRCRQVHSIGRFTEAAASGVGPNIVSAAPGKLCMGWSDCHGVFVGKLSAHTNRTARG